MSKQAGTATTKDPYPAVTAHLAKYAAEPEASLGRGNLYTTIKKPKDDFLQRLKKRIKERAKETGNHP